MTQTNKPEAPAAAINSLSLAAKAVNDIALALNNGMSVEFMAALEMIENCAGKLIVVGVGKSGHIGAKLASTFASTGTPSFFVHPTEASHGDLGMISPQDVVLMVSHSGETKELHDIIAYCKRFSLKLIAITGAANSLVARAASVVLVLPEARESCPHNLAPTTSTLMQLALGDAMAVSLVERRGFSIGNFRDFHPGGKLGASLIPVRELMLVDQQLPLLVATNSIIQGLDLLTEKSVGIIGAVDESNALIGVITDGDIRRYLARSAHSAIKEVLWHDPISSIMTQGPVSVAPNIMAAEALAIMQSHKISALFVLESGKPIGVITLLILLQAGMG